MCASVCVCFWPEGGFPITSEATSTVLHRGKKESCSLLPQTLFLDTNSTPTKVERIKWIRQNQHNMQIHFSASWFSQC